MVATRRGTVIEPAVEPGEPPAQKTSAELGTPVPQRQTRGTKSSEVGHDEFQLEDLHAAETLHVVDTSEPLNLSLKAASKNRSRAEPQSDGEVSEAESTCSTLSGLQTPSITRTTRRRQIIINCQTDSIQRNRSRKSVSTARPISESQEETEVSEAESNCSSFSGIHLSNISRRVSSRQNINRFPLTVANECQPEEVSDAESCCSGISASQAANRVTRSRIAKAQAETIRQTQDLTREFTPECQTLPKNKPEDVSDAESWCSGIAAGPPVRRLTRNSLARSHARTESQPIARTESQPIASSELGSVEKAASDTEQTSVVSTRVLRNLRSRQPSQRQEELQSQSEVDSQSGGLKQDETPSSSNVAEKSQTRAITPNKPPPLWYKGEADHREERSSKAAQLEDVAAQPEHEDPEGSPANQKKSPKKGSKTILEPQQINKKFKLTIDSDVDCEITKVIEADSDDTDQINEDLKSRAQRNAELKKFTAKQTSMLEKDDCSMVFLSSGGEVSDTSSEDESDVSLVDSVIQKPALAQPSEDMRDTPGNELFIIDTAPGLDTNKKYYIEQDQLTHDVESAEEEFQEEDPSHEKTDDDDDDNDFIDEDENEALLRKPKPGFVLSTAIDTGLNIKDIGGLYISFDAEKQRPKGSALKVKKKEELLKRSVITPDFEKRESVPPYSESVQRLKKKRKEERDKTTGDGWFGMRAPELTDELKNDLKALKMRSAIDPKRFYKKNDREGFPKYFQVGTVVDSAVDFYHSRIPKKQRKKTIVEELLADSDFRRYNKKKYQQIMAEKAALAAGKKNRKKKAFRT